MELIERYVHEVARRLPAKMRDDVRVELRSLLTKAIEERAAVAGRAAGDDLATEVLREFGKPDEVALRYRPAQWLIGPELFPAFLFTARSVLLVPPSLLGGLTVLGMVLDPGRIPDFFRCKGIISFLGQYSRLALYNLGLVVLIFAILERSAQGRRRSQSAEEGDPRRLPRVEEPDRADVGELVFKVYAIVILFHRVQFLSRMVRPGLFPRRANPSPAGPALETVANPPALDQPGQAESLDCRCGAGLDKGRTGFLVSVQVRAALDCAAQRKWRRCSRRYWRRRWLRRSAFRARPLRLLFRTRLSAGCLVRQLLTDILRSGNSRAIAARAAALRGIVWRARRRKGGGPGRNESARFLYTDWAERHWFIRPFCVNLLGRFTGFSLAMLYKTYSAAVYGIDAYVVEVEVDVGSAKMGDFTVVGLPDVAVKESRERIKAALKNCGFDFPAPQGVTINLAPADIRKEGSAFDLPMALGILGCTGLFYGKTLESYIILGELSLDGGLRPVRGVLSAALAARERGVRNLVVPQANAREAAVVEGIDVYAVSSLPQAVDLVNAPESFQPVRVAAQEMLAAAAQYPVDLRDVRGQMAAKRALEVACAGAHNILLIGPPGAGKTMLAKRIPTILPAMSLEEAIETTRIHSVAGILEDSRGLVGTRPFRSPHHTISDAGLIGGGAVPRPGEVSLAHHGVLFLDELPEFERNVLEVMRQPLEDGTVTIARAAISVTFPSRFMLAAAMNPCPCGFFGDGTRECKCTPPQIQRYVSKISGPLLDRIDIHIEVPAVKYRELRGHAEIEDSAAVRQRVERARQAQRQRFAGEKKIFANAQMPPRMIRKHCAISAEAEKALENAVARLGLSARAHDRILKVARTIADLAGAADIETKHLNEAVQYRSLDRSYWA